MVKMLKTILYGTILAVFFSCAKQEIPKSEAIPEKKEISISTLKQYMAKLINVDVSLITFNEKTEQFSLLGIEQISKQELTESYERSKK